MRRCLGGRIRSHEISKWYLIRYRVKSIIGLHGGVFALCRGTGVDLISYFDGFIFRGVVVGYDRSFLL